MIFGLRIVALLVAVTVHEFAHGKVADLLGDPTAKKGGRLSLNPIRHLDPLGSLMIVLVGFGWAKPVPVNPANFRDPVRHMMLVGLAGPLSNFLAAFVFGLALKWGFFGPGTLAAAVIQTIVVINVALGLFNLIPIPPLDGSKVLAAFLPRSVLPSYWAWEPYGIVVLFLMITIFGGVFLSRFLEPVLNLLVGFFL